MNDTITIPPEVVKALELALLGRPLSARNCSAAITAALAAWPGAEKNYNWDGSRWRIVLPNPPEPPATIVQYGRRTARGGLLRER